MIGFLSVIKIVDFLIVVLGFWLVFWVYFTSRKARINQFFGLFTTFILLWITFSYFLNTSTEASQGIWWTKFGYAAAFLFLISVYFFIAFFPKEERFPILDKFVITIGIILCAITFFTDLLVKNVGFNQWGAYPILGKGAIYVVLVLFFLALLILGILFKKYSKLSKEEKLKAQYFLIGLTIFIVINIVFNVILSLRWNVFPYYHFGNYSAIFLLGFTAYAVLKKELFGIKVILTTLLVGSISILLFLDAFFLTQDITLQIVKGITLIIFLFFGFFLIRATQKEIRGKEEAENLLKAKTEFLSIASHQLRTPLTAIIGYSSMLKEGDYGAIPEKAGKAVNHIYDSSQRMIKLVNDFLSVSRMETGKTILKIQESSMNELIGQVIAGLELRAKEKNLYLEYNRPTKDHFANIDPAKIKEVLSNLIDNAIHYTEKGGITVTVQKNGKITVIISDTGAGMTPEEITSLFESFSRGSAGNELNTQGSGLGLYIAKKFVEMHNGEIHAASGGKDNGSTFYV
ncbi:MAG: ATP-binding protein, partial [Patescibacteria group bacterium]